MMTVLTVVDQIKPEHINIGGYAPIIAVVKASYPWLGAVAKKTDMRPVDGNLYQRAYELFLF